MFLLYKNYSHPNIFFRIFYCFIASCMILGYFIPSIQMMALIMSRGFGAGINNLIFVTTDDIFPSYIKSRCYGFLSFIGRIGAILMPIILFNLIKMGFNYFLLYMIGHCLVFGILEMFVKYKYKSETADKTDNSKAEIEMPPYNNLD